jgi:hypothetical protein
VLFGGYRLAKSTTEVLAFYKYIRRRYPDQLRIYLVNDNLSLHWTLLIREWAALHNVNSTSSWCRRQPPPAISIASRVTSTTAEFVINASAYASHAEVAVAFRRYLHRRNTDHHTSRIRLLESRSQIA